MRHALALLGLIAAQAVLADTPASAPPPPMDVHYDVPQDKGPQHVNAVLRVFPVGGSSGWHTHPGAEIAYLIEGEMTLERAGQPTRTLHAGESFMVPRGLAHNGANIGKVPARLAITYVTDKDAPVRSLTPAPQHADH
ncbi:cupin domain-containing protein [Novosphingobium sp. PS1R-30]|uniref:Cupin domain-containing protein n=1 Tax=Novosphingobium anseongense TaxID=3133436 RepID=A0ABU8RQ44_9SPHN